MRRIIGGDIVRVFPGIVGLLIAAITSLQPSESCADYAYVLLGQDNGLFRVDLETGNRTVVSDASTGLGTMFSNPWYVTSDFSGNLYVSDSNSDAIFRVDPLTGDRTIISNFETGTGPLLDAPHDMVVEAGGTLLLADSGLRAILRVDPTTGDRTVVSDTNMGSGVNFYPRGLFLDPSGTLYVTDALLDAVFSVDLTTGDRTIVSKMGDFPSVGGFVGSGPSIQSPRDIMAGPSGTLILPDLAQVLSIDIATGDRTVLASGTVGTGPPGWGEGIALDDDGTYLLPRDGTSFDALVRLDPNTLERTTVSEYNTVGTGPPLTNPRSLVYVVPEPSTLVLAGIGFVALVSARRRYFRSRPPD